MAELMDADQGTETIENTDIGWMGSMGDFGEGIPENIKTLIDNKKWDNVGQLADAFVELEKFNGGKLKIPKADDVDGWNTIFNQLGRPETHDKYTFKTESEVPVDDILIDSFKQFAHKEGYTQKQLQGAIQFQLDAIEAQEKIYNEQLETRRNENIQVMKDKWQADFEPTMTKIDATAEKLKVAEFFEQRGIDKEPEIVNMLLTIANSDSEDNLTGTGLPPEPKKTLSEQMAEIKASKAFTDKFDIGHKETMKKFIELNQEIANTGQTMAPRS